VNTILSLDPAADEIGPATDSQNERVDGADAQWGRFGGAALSEQRSGHHRQEPSAVEFHG
jgi:hypothetical protein